MAILTPRAISDLAQWHRADDVHTTSSTPLGNGDLVPQWSDHGVNVRAAGNGTASAQPNRRLSDGPNTNESVRFDGGDNIGTIAFTLAQQYTVFVVVKRNSGTGIQGLVERDPDNSNRHYQFRFNNDNLEVIAFNTAGSAFVGSRATAPGTWGIFSGIRRATNVQAYANGVAGTATTTTGTPTNPSVSMQIGRIRTGSQLNGDIVEVIVYGKDLSTTEHDDVLRYLADAHDLSVTLSDTSTYNGSGIRPGVRTESLTHNAVEITADAYVGGGTLLDTEVRITQGVAGTSVVYGPTSLGDTPTWPHVATGLTREVKYLRAEVRYEDAGGWGPWVASTPFTTLPPPLVDPETPEERAKDGAWTRNEPRAIRYVGTHDRTYFGFCSAAGDFWVYSIDHTTNVVHSGLVATGGPQNAHASPTLHIRADGRIQAIWTGHASNTMRSRVSLNPEDVTSWQAELVVSSTGTHTYPNPIKLSDRVVLHWRNGSGSSTWVQRYMESTDDGATWGSQVDFVDNKPERPYLACAKHPSSDRIDYVVSTGHPAEVANSLYHFYRLGSSFYKSDGTLIGDTSVLPLAPSDGTLVYDGTSLNGWQWDIGHDGSGNPVILFATIPGTTGHKMHHAKWTGSAWSVNEIDDVGGTVGTDAVDTAGGALDHTNPNRVWICKQTSAGVAHLYSYTTTDGGASWVGANQTPGATNESVQPAGVRNAHANLAVLWLRGTWTSFTNFTTVIQSLGAGGIPTAPTADTIVGNLLAPLIAEIQITAFGEGATSRRLERRAFGSADPWVQIGATVTDLVQNLFYDDTLSPNTHYEWSIVAVNDVGETRSNVVDLETPNTGRPDKPTVAVVVEGPDFINGSISAPTHPDAKEIILGEVWLERTNGSYIVEPGVVGIEEDFIFVFTGLSENGFLSGRWLDEDLNWSLPADRVAYTLVGDPVEEDPPEELTYGTIEEWLYSDDLGLSYWKHPTFALIARLRDPWFSYASLIVIRFSVYDELGALLSRSSSWASLNPGRQFNFLKAGKARRIGAWYVYHTGSGPLKSSSEVGLDFDVPLAKDSPRFSNIARGEIKTGVASIEWEEDSNHLLEPGLDRIWLARPGAALVLLGEVDSEGIGAYELAIDWDSLASGTAQLGISRLFLDETETPVRFSHFFVVNGNSYRFAGAGLTLAKGDIFGSVGEVDRWTEKTIDGHLGIERQGIATTAGGFAIKPELIGGTPRSFEVIVSGLFSTATGSGNLFQYVSDMKSFWGPGGFLDAELLFRVAIFRGTFGAIGGVTGQEEGNSNTVNWGLNHRLGRGSGTFHLASLNGGATDFSSHGNQSFLSQWNRNWKDPDPFYTIVMRVTQVAPTSYLIEGGMLGPDNERVSGFRLTTLRTSQVLPCSSCGVFVRSESGARVFIDSITVNVLAYGDCAVEPEPVIDPPEAVNNPCPPTGVDVSWTEPYLVEA